MRMGVSRKEASTLCPKPDIRSAIFCYFRASSSVLGQNASRTRAGASAVSFEQHAVADDIAASIDRLAADEAVQSNCMFQLALMVARIAAEPGAEVYKEEAAQALMALIRAKPKSNVVRLFGARSGADAAPSTMRVVG